MKNGCSGSVNRWYRNRKALDILCEFLRFQCEFLWVFCRKIVRFCDVFLLKNFLFILVLTASRIIDQPLGGDRKI